MAGNSIQSSPGSVYFSKSIKYVQLPMSAPSQTHMLATRAGGTLDQILLKSELRSKNVRLNPSKTDFWVI